MTRSTFDRTLRRVYALLIFVILTALFAKLAPLAYEIVGPEVLAIAGGVYDFLRDMALVFVTVVAVYLAHMFQRRSKFVESLEEEWRGLVHTKSALITYCEKPYPGADEYHGAVAMVSETLDNMRIVYRNAGETQGLIGLYPYAPLHDMRRALQSLDPRKKANISIAERKLVQDAILQSFYALRECFLEELYLEEPSHPLLIAGGRRMKKSGGTSKALAVQAAQRARQDRDASGRSDIEMFLRRLHDAEAAGPTAADLTVAETDKPRPVAAPARRPI